MATTAFKFPDISPELFSFNLGGFEFALRWYALAYIVGIIIALQIIKFLLSKENLWSFKTPPMAKSQTDDLITFLILGIIIGGRSGFVFFYQLEYYLHNPWEIFMVWQGGMSFHGGLIGVILATLWFCHRNSLPVLSVGDLIAVATPPGIFLGRLSNFVNSELWGRPTEWSFGVVFPGTLAQSCPGYSEPCARHASQLYEAGLEGLILGCIMLWLAVNKKWLTRPGCLIGFFIFAYGLFRFLVEFFRQPDSYFITNENPLGYLLSSSNLSLTMGQALSLPMIIFGLLIIILRYKK